jgi:hypothetical protein
LGAFVAHIAAIVAVCRTRAVGIGQEERCQTRAAIAARLVNNNNQNNNRNNNRNNNNNHTIIIIIIIINANYRSFAT